MNKQFSKHLESLICLLRTFATSHLLNSSSKYYRETTAVDIRNISTLVINANFISAVVHTIFLSLYGLCKPYNKMNNE